MTAGRSVPAFSSHKGFDVQVHGHVFGRDDGNSHTAGQVLGAGVHHVTLAFEDALGEDQHGPDDGFWEKNETCFTCTVCSWRLFPRLVLPASTVRGGDAQLDVGPLALRSGTDGEGGLELGVGRDDAHS